MNSMLNDTDLEISVRDQVDSHRRARAARLEDLISMASRTPVRWDQEARADLALWYALLHHCLGALEDGARNGDNAAMADALAMCRDTSGLRPLITQTGRVVVGRPEPDRLTLDRSRSDSPVALMTPDVGDAALSGHREIVGRAMADAGRSGFGDLVGRNSRVVMLLEERELGADVRSWTTNSLPCTVHLDFYPVHHFVTRDLIHEAAHTELNDVIQALGVEFPDDVAYFAPWREMNRPAFGFLHGVWAFSHVFLYCEWLAGGDAPSGIRALAGSMARYHAGHLRQVFESSERALEAVGNETFARLLSRRRDEAIAAAR